MRPVEMNRTGMLAAAMHAVLEDRLVKAEVKDFSVQIQLLPGCFPNQDVMLGNMISGYIKTRNHINGKEFVVAFTDDGDIRIEIPRKTVLYPKLDTQVVTYIDVKEPIEINFSKRSITYKKVYNFNMKNVSWDWKAVKGTALDIIGMILGDENS